MFKSGLLISTAMTAVALLLSDTHAQTDMHVANRDSNTRFLCTYGSFRVTFFSSAPSASQFSSSWKRVAVPVIGHGQAVSVIEVIMSKGNHSFSAPFSAGIYSNSPSGFPGNRIVGSRGQVGASCERVGISFSRTKLQPNTKYWIEVRAEPYHYSNSLYWEANAQAKHQAYVQTHRFLSSSSIVSSHTSPWKKQSKGPWLRLK